jgi:hypothetical protein
MLAIYFSKRGQNDDHQEDRGRFYYCLTTANRTEKGEFQWIEMKLER